MADRKPWEEFSNTTSSDAAAEPKPWETFGGETQPKPKGFLGHTRDLGLSAVKSAIAVPETVVGLADIPTGGRVGKFLENEGGAVGFRPKQAKEFVSEFHTDQYKDQQRQFQDADGILDKTAVAIQNPSLIANTVVESVAPMLAGGVAARGLMAGTRLGQMGAKGAAAAGAIGEGTMMAGSQASAIRQETDDGLLTPTQAGAAVATGLAGTLFGYLGGRVAQRFGLGDVDTMLARGANPQQVASEIAALPAKSVPRQVIEGAISEGFLEELPQSISEQIIQNLALGKDWSEGVEDAAVMGTLAGMAMGGGASLYNGMTRPEPQDGGLPPPAAGNEPPAAPPRGFAPTSERPVIDEAALGRAGVFPPAPAPIINERALAPAAPTPSQQMGLNPAAGPMSAAAALAVDTGASATMQQAAQAVDPETGEILETGARVPEQKQATDTPEQMRERLGFIEQQARANGGWDRRIIEERDRLQAELAKVEPAADQVPGATEMIEPAPTIDVSGRTDEQLRVLEKAGRDGWREAAVAEIQRRAAQQPAAAPELETQPVAADAPTMAAPQAYAAPVADIKTVIAKQIQDMTEGELQQAISHYGPAHKRTAKLQKELQKRGQGVQTTAAIAPGDSVHVADGLGSDVDGQPWRVVSVRGDTASVEVAGERYDDVPVSELKKQASAAASEGWDGMTAEQRAALLTKPGGWSTAKGKLNVIGKKIAGQNWSKINPTTRATIERLMQGEQTANVPTAEQVAPQAQEARGQEGEKAKWIKAAVDKSRLNGSGGVQLAVAPNGGVTFMGDPNTSKDGKALLANYEKALASGATQQEIAAALQAQAQRADAAQGQAQQGNQPETSQEAPVPEQDRRLMQSGLSFPSERIVTSVQSEFEALEVQASSIGTSDGYVNFGSQYPDGRYYIESAGKSIGFANGQWGDITPEGLKPRGTYDPDKLQVETIRVLESEGAKRSKPAEPAQAPADVALADEGKSGGESVIAKMRKRDRNAIDPGTGVSYYENDVSRAESELRQTIYEEQRSPDFAPSELPKAIEFAAKEDNVTTEDLRNALLRGIDGDERFSDGRKKQIRAAFRKAMFGDTPTESAAPEHRAKLRETVKTVLANENQESKTDKPALYAELRDKLRALADRAMNAGDGRLSGRISGFTQGMREDDRNLTRAWVDEVVAEREKMVKRAEKAAGIEMKPTGQPNAEAADRFAKNKLFTADKVAAARARMKAKLGTLNSGIDPELLVDGMTIAGAYIESGIRNFTQYAKAMIEDMGDGVKPYLLSFWEGARNYPGLDAKNMTGAEESRRQFDALLAPEDLKTDAVGEIAEKPKKRARKSGEKGDAVLTQDWGVETIDGYGDDAREVGNDTKDAFLKETRGYLNAVADQLRALGFEPHVDGKGRPAKPVHSSEGGVAGSGDVSLTMRNAETGQNVYIHIGDTSLRGAVPVTPSGVAVMFRTGSTENQFVTGGTNQWAPVDLSAKDLAQLVNESAAANKPARAAEQQEKRNNEPAADGAQDQGRAEAVRGGRGDSQPGSAPADSGSVAPRQSEDGRPAGEAGDSGRSGVRVSGADVARGEGVPQGRVSGNGRARAGGAGSPDAGAGGAGSAGELGGVSSPAATSAQAQDLHVDNPLEIVGGSPVQRFNRNRAALELLQTLTEEGRQATPHEQKVLAGYIGWGSFGQELFQGSWERPAYKDEGIWKERGQWLRETLGESAWKSAQRSITNAHYTDPPTVLAMWDMVRRMGFDGGKVLEPSMGTGNFFSMMPADLKARSQLTGIELDETTGAIAKQLFPRSNVRIMGYQDSKTPDGFYDLIIGNWPFENTPVADRRYNKLNPMLHDYFFLKTMDQVRPGGIVIGITSAGSMDKQNTTVRRELAKQAELVAAIRLPSGAFEEYAGTKVVTDIVILRKRPQRLVATPSDATWVETGDYKTPAGETIKVNRYYLDNPQNIIGTLDFGSGTTTFRAGMIVRRPENMADQLQKAIGLVPQGAMLPRGKVDHLTYYANETGERHGALALVNDRLMIAVGDQLVEANEARKYALKDAKKTAVREQQLRAAIDLRKKHAALVDAERGWRPADDARKALRGAYDAFVKAHGGLRDSFALEYLERINDPFFAELAALENDDGTPAAVMERSTTRGRRTLDNPSVRDAYVLARNQSVNPSVAEVARLAGKSEQAVKAELLDSGAVFEAPNGDVVPSDIYLSGNVRQKLRDAQTALDDGNAAMRVNVAALKEVMPEDVPYFNIETQFGATWVPNESYAQYIAHMLGQSSPKGIEVSFRAGRWKVKMESGLSRIPEAAANYGTPGYPFSRLVQAAISNQVLRLTSKDENGNDVYDAERTEKANARIAKIREDFGAWLWSDPERRQDLEREYNEARNAWATPTYDGSFLTFEGMALTLGNGAFQLRQHQVNAIWRAIVNRRSINAHEVGTGKTFTMGGIAVESRRYGIAKKPMLLAHNANSATVAAEIRMMYPSARVLYVDNLQGDKKEIRLRQIANDDWDVIVVPHSLISNLALREETMMRMAEDDIKALEAEFFDAAREDNINPDAIDLDDDEDIAKIRSVTAKELAKARKRIIENIKKQAQKSSKEGAIAFEDLGVDMILVDEAHEFKKPPIVTRMKMKGLNTQVSNRSIALQFLTRYVRQMNNGGNVHTFTGTPITNTITEIYHQMRYVMEAEMEQATIADWDGWFGSFAAEVQDVELTAAGDYEMVSRLAGFVNVPELRAMVGQYMDTVFAEDMPEMRPRKVNGKELSDPALTEAERAELLNGRTEGAKDRPYKKVVNDSADMTAEQMRIFTRLQQYAREWRAATGKQKKEWMRAGDPRSPIITEGIANKASFDVRLLDDDGFAGQEGRVPDEPTSKASRVVKNVLEIYNSHPNANQVIFSETGFGKRATRSAGVHDGEKQKFTVPVFATMHDIVERLVQGGIPREQIAIVDGSTSKERRKEIAEAMNSSKIRIVIGSTDTLGVGVNMQRNLRAMHHVDAPYMPGELEQRNGRGLRQGNQWNTVLEYRYMTDRLDGKRWQILAVKQRFINAFMKAAAGTRVIEGEAAADEQSDILESFSEAAGDPRILQRVKMQKKLETLHRKERMYTQGIADMRRQERSSAEIADRLTRELKQLADSRTQANVDALIASQQQAFAATIDGTTYDTRKDAADALQAFIEANVRIGDSMKTVGEYAGHPLRIEWPRHMDVPVTQIDAFGQEFAGKGIAGAEAKMRNFLSVIENKTKRRDMERSTAENMRAAMNQPFAQAADLERITKQLQDLEKDLEINPVPPPAWLRQAAPIDSEVHRNKRPYIVTGHRYSKEGWFVIAEDAKGTVLIPYMEATDEVGMPMYEEREFVPPVVIEKEKEGAAPADAPADVVVDRAAQSATTNPLRNADGTFARQDPAGDSLAFSATLPRDRNAVRIGITEKGLVRAMRLQFDGLAEITGKLLERGRAGKRGGVIVVGTADNAEIGRIVAERTGRKLDSTMRKFSSAGRLNGFYDPKTGLTFLVGPNLNPVTATAVMLHEMMHGQQRQKIDARALEMVRNRHSLKDEDLRAFLDRVMLRMIAAGEVGNAAEASAYIVEQAVIEGRSAGYTFADGAFMQWVDAKIGKRVGDFLRSFAGMIRTWMLRNGLGAKAMTVDDFVGYAMAGLDRAAAGSVRDRANAKASIDAWHGSPYRFDRFDLGNVGMGEGAQAYGWGLYFASSKEVAEHYRNMGGYSLAPASDAAKARFSEATNFAWGAVRGVSDALSSNKGDVGKTVARLRGFYADTNRTEMRAAYLTIADMLEAGDLTAKREGATYKVTIAPTEDAFLLWDKPLGEQPKKVAQGLRSAIDAMFGNGTFDTYAATGNDWRDMKDNMLENMSEKDVSLMLKANGIAGVKYLDGMSRDGKGGSSNYVVFDDADVEIDDIRFSRSVGDAPAQEAQRVQSAIEGKTLIEAAQFLTRSKGGAKAAVAQKVMEKLQRLEKAGVALDLKVVHRGDMAPASMVNSRGYTETGFDEKGRDIVVWLNGADVTGRVGTEEEVLLHELVHAATAGMVFYGTQTPNSLAGKHARDLMAVTDAIAEHIRKRFDEADAGKATLTEFEQDMRDGANNAFRSDDEVLAWALSNSEAQAYLETIPYRSGSMWSNFVQAVRNLLGLGARNDTALSEVLRVAERILTDDAPNAGRAAFWHKRNIRMAQQQVRGSIVQTAERGTDDLQFSRSGLAGAQEAAKNIGAGLKAITVQDVKRAGKHKLTDWLKLGLQFLGRRQIVDVYGDVLPLADYDRLAAQMEADKNDVGAAADELARRWGKLPDEGKLADLMHDATLAQIDADSAVEYAPGDDLAKSRALKAQFGQLSTEAQKVYREARDHYRKHHAEVRQAIIDRIMRSELREERRAELLQRMDADFFKAIKGVYFPLSRFGQYVVVTKDDAGNVASVSRAETMAEAETMRAEMVKAFPARDGYQVGRVILSKEFVAGRDMVGRGFMTELYEALDEQGLDPRVQAELEDTLGQLYLSSLPDLSWAKHGIHRKGTPGFSSDARRAFAQNTFHGARYLAKLKYGDQMQSELDRMQKHVDEMAPIEGFDQPAAQRVVDEMNKRHEATMNPKGNPLSTALTSFGFVYYLGISPAAAMVNLSQTPLVAYPVLGAKWGFRKASAALMTASKETMEGKNDLRSRLKNPDEIAAYDEAVRTGVIDVTMAHDLAGIAQGEDAKVMWKIRPVMRLASYLFHHAERFNRQATFLAAYRLARDAGAKHDTAYSQAVKATYDGHFDYSTGNRPRVMQGNVAKVVLLFKQYAQNMIYTLARNAYQSVKGESPEVRREARKVFGALMTMHAAAAGVLGLPMVGTLLTLASALGGSDDEPWDAEVAMRNMLADTFGTKPAEVIARGFSRMTPWDISGRVGLDKLLLPDVNESLEGQRWAESFATAMLGPVIGIGVNVSKGAQKMADGDYARGLEDMMPVVVRNGFKAYRQYSEGEVDRTGVVIKDEVSLAGVLGQASGFSPSEIRLAFEGRSAVMSADRRLAERRQDLMTQFARAAMDQDQDGMTEARAAIADFNKVNPGRRITPPQMWQSVRNRQRRIREAGEGVYLPRTRRDVADEGRFAMAG